MSNLIKVQGTYQLPYIIKAEWTAYFVFSVIFGPITLLWVVVLMMHPESNAWQPILISLSGLTLFLVWIGSLRVILEENKISYKTLFSKYKELIFSEIKKIEINTGREMSASEKTENISHGGWVRMDIFSNSIDCLSINMKLFSRRDLAIIVDAVSIANPNIRLDNLSLNLKQGDFKPIVSATIKTVWQVVLWIFWIFLVANLIKYFLR